MTEKRSEVSSLLEAGIGDVERVAVRREALEAMRRSELAKEKQAVTIRLNDGLRRDPRAILVSDPTFARQNHQITLRVGEQAEPITVQSDRLPPNNSIDRTMTRRNEVVITSIYTGEASAALEANPTDYTTLEPAQVVYDSLHSYRSAGSDFSSGDVQADVADIMLLDALSEQLAPAPDVNAVAQVGHIAVQA